jgi:hypothetical protein
MEPLDFLAAVLPSPEYGRYCVAEFTSRKEQVFTNTLEETQGAVARMLKNKDCVYYAMSTFGPEDKRTAANAQYIKSLFIDMDGYASKKDAAQALNAFLENTGLGELGTPWIVNSGGGLHCYWPLKEALPVETWKPVAENFKRLCHQQDMAIDMTVTADAARVLRVPGTMNFKKKYPEPRPVRILNTGDVFDFDAFAAIVRGQLKGSVYEATGVVDKLDLPGARPAASTSATAVKLFENSKTSFKKIWMLTKEGSGCSQLANYAENAQDEGMEPIWRGLLSWTKVCADGTKAAVWLSKMHPYDADRMNQKLRDIKGPYPCVKMDSENPGICPNCPNWGKITNPLILGREIEVDVSVKDLEVEVQSEGYAAPKEVIKVQRPVPPRGYAYGANGGVFMERMVEDEEGGKSKKQVMLLPYELFVVDILNSNNEHTVHMIALKPEGAVNVTMPQKAVVSKDETAKALASQNVVASFGAGNDKNLAEYVRACVEECSMNKPAIRVPDSYGWQPDNSYVYAGRIFSKGKEPIKVPMPGLENITMHTEPKGTLENWQAFINMLVHRKMWGHLAVVLAGAGAPFMRFTGIYGMTYHCASTESGTGKSLSLEAAASVWGHPVHYRTGKSTSPVAMQQRLGLLNSHPLITDEITAKNRKDFEWLPEFLLDMTEGRGKERMESGSNKERLNLSTWMTTCLMSSNTHIVDYLSGGRQHSSEGELRRLIEFVFDKPLEWEAHEIETIKSLAHNYGHAGFMLSQVLVDRFDEWPEFVTKAVTNMYGEFKATNDERFWMAGIGAAISAAVVLKQSGIAEIPLRPIINAFKKAIENMRASMKISARNAEDVLNSFTRDNYGSFVVIKPSKGGVLAELGSGGQIDLTTARTKVMGRVEHELTPGYIDYFVEEQVFKAYCASMSFGYTSFKRGLEDMFMVQYIKKDMMSRTKGPPMRVQVMKIRRKAEDVGEDIISPIPVAED